MRAVQRAVDNTLVLDFSYTDIAGRESRRTVEPHTLVFKGYAWYVIAYCRLRDDFRLFRLSRISRPSLCREPFLRREVGDLQRFFNFDCGLTMPVTFRCSVSVRARVEDYFPGVELSQDDTGWFVARLDLPEDSWLLSLFLGFGPDLEVIAPPSWRRRMAEIASSMKNLYAT